MAKFDVASAYRNVAIHPDDHPLLGRQWRGQYFVDLVLPFGMLSAPFIFTAIADLVEWIMVHNYDVTFLHHYLDDFLTLGPPSSPVCHNNLQTCVRLCKQLGLPFILISWRVLQLVLFSLGLNLTLKHFRLASRLRRGIGLLLC